MPGSLFGVIGVLSASVFTFIAVRRKHHSDTFLNVVEVVLLFVFIFLTAFLYYDTIEQTWIHKPWGIYPGIGIVIIMVSYLGMILYWSNKTGVSGIKVGRDVAHLTGLTLLVLGLVITKRRELVNLGTVFSNLQEVSFLRILYIVYDVLLQQLLFVCFMPLLVLGMLKDFSNIKEKHKQIICVALCGTFFSITHFPLSIALFLSFFVFYIQVYVMKHFTNSILYAAIFHSIGNIFVYFCEMGIFV